MNYCAHLATLKKNFMRYQMGSKWDKLETKIWRVILFKEDKKGNQRFYEYDGDHTFIAEQMYDVDNKYLIEIEENKK